MVDITDVQEEAIDALEEVPRVIMRTLIEHAHERDGRIVACCDTEESLRRRVRRDTGKSVGRSAIQNGKRKLITRGFLKQTVQGGNGTLSEYMLFPGEDEMTANGGMVIAGNKFDGILKSMGPGSYEGTCRMPNGKYDRKKFKVQDSNLAKKMWERWCEEVRQNKEQTQPRKPVSIDEEVQEETVESGEEAMKEQGADKVYCIMTKGGEPFRFAKTLDAAIAAADMLSAAIKAAGADITYDVVEVGLWEW